MTKKHWIFAICLGIVCFITFNVLAESVRKPRVNKYGYNYRSRYQNRNREIINPPMLKCEMSVSRWDVAIDEFAVQISPIINCNALGQVPCRWMNRLWLYVLDTETNQFVLWRPMVGSYTDYVDCGNSDRGIGWSVFLSSIPAGHAWAMKYELFDYRYTPPLFVAYKTVYFNN